jgi:hypothetical protein
MVVAHSRGPSQTLAAPSRCGIMSRRFRLPSTQIVLPLGKRNDRYGLPKLFETVKAACIKDFLLSISSTLRRGAARMGYEIHVGSRAGACFSPALALERRGHEIGQAGHLSAPVLIGPGSDLARQAGLPCPGRGNNRGSR